MPFFNSFVLTNSNFAAKVEKSEPADNNLSIKRNIKAKGKEVGRYIINVSGIYVFSIIFCTRIQGLHTGFRKRVFVADCFCLHFASSAKSLFMRVLRRPKICLTYFEICALYFEKGRTYFFGGPNGVFFDIIFSFTFFTHVLFLKIRVPGSAMVLNLFEKAQRL